MKTLARGRRILLLIGPASTEAERTNTAAERSIFLLLFYEERDERIGMIEEIEESTDQSSLNRSEMEKRDSSRVLALFWTPSGVRRLKKDQKASEFKLNDLKVRSYDSYRMRHADYLHLRNITEVLFIVLRDEIIY